MNNDKKVGQYAPSNQRRWAVEEGNTPPVSIETVEAAWLEEAQRRAAELESGEMSACDGDQALAELEAKLRGLAK